MDNPIILIVFLAIFMGFSIFSQNRQRKQAQERYEQLKKLSKGDQIVTLGGLYASVDSVDADKGTVVLDADGIFLTYELTAIKRVLKAHLADGTVETAVAEEN